MKNAQPPVDLVPPAMTSSNVVHPNETSGLKEMEMTAEFKKFKASNYKQQEMKAFRPKAGVSCIVGCFGLMGVCFIAVGAVILSMSAGTSSTAVMRYDHKPECAAALKRSPCYTEQFDDAGDPKALSGVPMNPLCADRSAAVADWATAGAAGDDVTCSVTMTVTEAMEPPIFLHYQLTNFFQNHRRYTTNRLDQQLRGQDWTSKKLYETAVLDKCASAADTCTSGAVESKLAADGTTQLYWCNPCGLVARSFFTDQFALQDPGGAYVPMTNASISWDSDLEHKYKKTTDPERKDGVAGVANKYNLRTDAEEELVTDADFIVWMRTAALPQFRKLYRVIETKLEPGDYTVTVRNNFDVSYFEGEKALVMGTTSGIGGPNTKLGWAYIVVGVLCVAAAIFLALKEKFSKKVE